MFWHLILALLPYFFASLPGLDWSASVSLGIVCNRDGCAPVRVCDCAATNVRSSVKTQPMELTVAITGASGAIYAHRTLVHLAASGVVGTLGAFMRLVDDLEASAIAAMGVQADEQAFLEAYRQVAPYFQ